MIFVTYLILRCHNRHIDFLRFIIVSALVGMISDERALQAEAEAEVQAEVLGHAAEDQNQIRTSSW